MTANIREILYQSEGRYLNAAEREQLLTLARELPGRVQAGEQVESHEQEIIEAVIAALRARYPRFEKLFPQAWERLAADLRMVLRADVRAAVADDVAALDDSALYYLRSILAAYNVTPEFVRDAFSLLRDSVADRLNADAFAVMEPFLDRNVEKLADIPEPAIAMV